MKLTKLTPITLALLAASLAHMAAQSAANPPLAPLTTRQRTIRPVALTNAPPVIYPSAVSNYAVYGYSSWQWGPGEDEGQQFTNMPAGYTGATNAARLLSFLSLSDAHITDKESPCQAIYASYQGGIGINPSTYSPVMLYTTQVLDAGVRTANALHRLTPFDFAISLGDPANGPQYNELRWFIDVMDGKYITPSSGTNAGADTIDYQKPFQAAGLDPSIPWYAVIGNHDHFWMGGLPIEYGMGGEPLQEYYTNENVLLVAGNYMGNIDGSTPYGDVINVGSVTNFIVGGVTNTPKVAADANRYSLTRSNWMREFFTTTSKPVGHGFSPANVTNDFACYSFEPKADMPIKVIVLDDTMTDEDFVFGGQGSLDTNHFNWLVHELDKGQAEDKLMIIAAHVPLELIGTNSPISNTTLLATLHTYPNLLLWINGHVHENNIIPQPSPYPDRPEYGFWEVETASLRDFPQEFRTFEILRNTDNSISIRVTDIDPEVTTNSPAAVSRGYAVGAARIFMTPCTSLTDTNSYAHNAELLKLLTPPMQTKIAGYGGPLGPRADWSFVMLGDTRGADDTATGVSPYLNTIAQKIASLNPELVMMAGDLCNGDALNTNSPVYPADGNFTNAAAKAIYAGFFANWKTAMQPIFNYSTGTGIPIYTVRGNHENEDGEHAPISVLKQAYYDAFSAYVPANGPSNSLADDQRGFSWSFTHNNVTFVAADQYFNYTNASPDQLSGYHSLDRAWVTQQFQQSTSPYKIFMAHEPIFQTEGNGPGEMENEEAQHFFGTNTVGLLTRADFWNALGTNGVQLYLTGHLHLETVASTTNDYGNIIIQLTAGNGGAPPQPFIDNPEPGVTTLFHNTNKMFGFSLATVRADAMKIEYYLLNTNDNSWTVADYVTQIAFDSNQPRGTPNWWLAKYAVTEEYDEGDHVPAWQEYIADTDPTNAVSYFHIVAISNLPPTTVTFLSSSNRYYTLQRRNDLLGTWTNVTAQVGIHGAGGLDSLQDTTVASQQFYRVEVKVTP